MYKFIKRSCVAATLILAFVVTLASPLTVFAAPSSSTGVLANSPQISPPNTFILSFDANGGSGTQAPIAVDINKPGQPLPGSTPAHPLTITPPAGKGFVGWSLTPTGTPTYYNDPSIRVDTTYYAIWGNTVTVDFNANGGSGTQTSQIIGAGFVFSPPYASNVTLIAPSGKQFAGWSLTPDGALFTGGPIDANTTLFAIWGVQATLTFDANGGSGTQAPQTIITGGSLYLPTDSNLTLTAPEGKLFSGWALTPTGEPLSFSNSENTQLINRDTTLYAIWGEPVTLTFDFNGGTGTQPPITEGKGRVIYLSMVYNGLYVAPEGKTFGGWSLTVDGEAINEYRFTEDATLYAVWEGGTPTPTPDIPYAPSGTVNTQGSTLPAGTALNTNTATDVQVASMIDYAKNLQLRGAYAFISDITLLDANGNPVQPDGNTLIRIDIAGLSPQDKVIVVHEKSDGSFELITATVYDGYLTFKPTSFSLYGVLVEKGAGAAITTALSPQTGAVR